MEKETVFILLLLKPMTKTSQRNEIATMIYWWVPCVKNINSLFFYHYVDENYMKDMKMEKKRDCIIYY